MFHGFDVLVKAFSLVLSHRSKIWGEVVQVAIKEMQFDTHVCSQSLISNQQILNYNVVIFGPKVAKEICNHVRKADQASFFMVFMVLRNSLSLIRSLICGPSNMPAFNFSCERTGNLIQMYLKHSPSQSKALTNCFISPNFICSGGSNTFWGLTSGSFLIFISPIVKFSLAGHSVLV